MIKQTKYGNTVSFADEDIKKVKDKYVLYILNITPPNLIGIHHKIKVGYSKRLWKRLLELSRQYKCDITVVGYITFNSKYSAIRYEDKLRDSLKDKGVWILNDRFVLPLDLKTIELKVKKNYIFHL